MIRRFARIAWIMALAVSCNPRKQLLETATDAHAHHAIDRAFDALGELVDTAPSSPEASLVPALAIQWGIEASDASVAEGRTRYLTRALALAPKSGELAARLCARAADENFEALRHCLDLDLLGKTGTPEAIVAPLRARLATYDDGQERARLLASALPDDWALLRAKYPASPEAAAVVPKIARATSFCADRDRFLPPIGDAIAEMRDALKPPVTSGVVVAFLAMRTRANERAEALEGSLDRLVAHRIAPDEAKVRDRVAELLSALVRANRILEAELSRAIQTNDLDHYTRSIVQFTRTMRQVSRPLDSRVRAIESACAARAASPR